MNLRHYLLALILGDAAAWMSWLLILLLVNPTAATLPVFIGFFSTLFLALLGLFTIALTVARLRNRDEGDVEDCLRVGVRQGFLLATLSVAALILSSLQLFSFWVMILLLAIAGIAEYSSQASESRRSG